MIAKIISRNVFISAPKPGVGVLGACYQASLDGQDMVSIHSTISRSDTVDMACMRHSHDGGQTWSDVVPWITKFDHPMGTKRRHPRGGYVHPQTGRYVFFWIEGVLPTDDPLEGMRQWTVHYSVSNDGGKTEIINEQIIHEGTIYNALHPLPGVTVGKNCAMIGDLGQRPITRSDGVILVPILSSPTGKGGTYHNPGAGYTYTDCMVLLGHWQPDGRLLWTCSERIVGDPMRTTRGLDEPTLAELRNDSMVMVMRGSNDVHPEWPGHKWVSRSFDKGHTWTVAQPWTYDTQEPFYSPSACSQLIPHHSGRLFWMGNITPQNPRGNRPRYPLILGEVDRETGCLIKKSVTVIDTRKPDEHEGITLSNFYVREDSQGDLYLYLPRLFARDPGDWTADLMVYHIVLT